MPSLLAAMAVGAGVASFDEEWGQAGVAAAAAPETELVAGRLVVKFRDGIPPSTERKVLADAAVRVETTVRPLDIHVVEVPPADAREALTELAAAPGVEYIELDARVESLATTPNDTLWSQQWGPVRISAPSAWDATTGSSAIVVAVLDTGIDGTHPDLQDALVAGYDFVEGDSSPTDENGHGTAAAGVVGARTNNGKGQAGICWRCSLMPVKVLNADRAGTTSAVAAGVVWAADRGARVISMSLGGSQPTQMLADAVDYAVSKGIVLVAAAGNEGSQELSYPAAYVGVIGVAGSAENDVLYGWSNYGSWVHVAAPGCNIAPALGAQYVNFCGTSAAAPLVAGIAGLAFSGRPTATRTDVENALFHSAAPIGASVRYGRVNAELTLAALGVKPPSPAPPAPAPAAPPAPAPAPTPTPLAPGPSVIPDRPLPAPERPQPEPPSLSGVPAPPRASAPPVTTIRGRLRGKPLRLGARAVRAGRLIGTLTAPRARTLTLTLVDPRGSRVARISGRSPLRLSRQVRAQRYRFVVAGTRRARFTLRIESGRN